MPTTVSAKQSSRKMDRRGEKPGRPNSSVCILLKLHASDGLNPVRVVRSTFMRTLFVFNIKLFRFKFMGEKFYRIIDRSRLDWSKWNENSWLFSFLMHFNFRQWPKLGTEIIILKSINIRRIHYFKL
jgi:hypothetical protein